MDVFDAIRTRRSIRKFSGDAISKEDLEQIVDAGRLAASGSNQQPWEFIVVTERDTIDALSVAARWMKTAGAVIVLVMDPASRWWLEDGSAAVENMLIASVALGYGACWVEGNALPHEENFQELLGVRERKRVVFLVPIGVPVEKPIKEKKSLQSVIHWERY